MTARAWLSLLLLNVACVSCAAAAATIAVFEQEATFNLLPSSVECPEAGVLPPGSKPGFYRPCTFQNLYLWNGSAHYIVQEGAQHPKLEQLGLRFEVWSKKEDSSAVLGFMRTTTAAKFGRLLAEGTPAGAPAAGQGGQRQSTAGQEASSPYPAEDVIPRAYLWKARGVTPSQNGGHCDPPSSGNTGKANYGHFSVEWMPPLYMTLCEHFGHCTYADRAQLAIIDVQPKQCNSLENYPPFYHEELACLSSTPLQHIAGPSLRGRLVRLQEAWVGLGPRCRGIVDGCYERGSGRLPPTPALLTGWRSLLGQCYGAELQAPAPLKPAQLLVVDRHYASGRHLLNINSFVRALRSRYPAELVRVELAYMEGLTVRQQAALWSASTVVVHMHGAALGNYFFLPHHAVAVQLSALPEELGQYNPTKYTRQLASDLAGVSDIAAIDWSNTEPSHVHLNTEHVATTLARKPHLARFVQNRTAYGEFLATWRCPQGLPRELQAACTSLLLHLNLVLDPSEAVSLTETALRRAFKAQGRQFPPLDSDAGGGGGGAGGEVGGGGKAEGEGGGVKEGLNAAEQRQREQGEQQEEAIPVGQQQQREEDGAADLQQQPQRQRQRQQQRRVPAGVAGAELRKLGRLQTEGGLQLLVCGIAVGSLAVLGLAAAGRLIPRRKG